MSGAVDLKALSPDDQRRSLPLIEVGARYRLPGTKTWRAVGPTWRIARCCFNDLGPAWTEHTEWQGHAAQPAEGAPT